MLKVKTETKDITKWFNYKPEGLSSMEYSASQIMSLEKIRDVYHSLEFGRLCRANIFTTECGEVIDDDKERLGRGIVRAMNMNNCLTYYSYCIDYALQVLWLYYSDIDESEFNYMDKYIELTSNFRKNKLENLLKNKGKNDLIYKIDSFIGNPRKKNQGNPEIKKIINLYNNTKHRGFYHIEGLGDNSKKSPIVVNGKRIPLLYREEIDLHELEEDLIKFDNLFVEFFEENIITTVVPDKLKNV